MAPEAKPATLPRRPLPLGRRGVVLLLILVAAVWSMAALGIGPADLLPRDGALPALGEFFGAAFSPALEYELENVPEDALPLPLHALEAAGLTLTFAAAGMSLALLLGIVFGFFASTAWWAEDPAGARSPIVAVLRRTVAPTLYVASRTLIAFLRSIHEIIWAVLFLAAFGRSDFAAVLAIALPFSGVLAKIFSELIDEAPRTAALALRGAGAPGVSVFFFGLVPIALPDMISYAFYRFECALRAAAVLGFFGYATIGQSIREAFIAGMYHQLWTYLYVLVLLVLLVDMWGARIRRRFTT